MKTLLFIAISSFSTLALSCPDLSGQYTCTSDPHMPSEMASSYTEGSVSQSVDGNGITTYKIAIGEMKLRPLKADGVEVSSDTVVEDLTLRITDKSYCDENVLVTEGSMQILGKEEFDQESVVTYQKEAGVLKMSVNYRGNNLMTFNCH